jgi:peptide/nickel transport system permease protein
MINYIIRRLLWMVVILWGVSLLTFFVAYLVPADPARAFVGNRPVSADVLANMRHQMGLDRPVPVQYLDYLGHVLRGDFGFSYYLHQPVLPSILSHFPATAELAVAGLFVEIVFGLTLGVLAALHRNGWPDRLVLLFSLFSISAPTFVVGVLFLFVLGSMVPIFPLGGYGGIQYLILPALTLGLGGAGWYARTLRSTMLDVMSMDYVRTARAKGVRGLGVTLRHVMRNALGPIVTALGIDLAYFLGGVLIIETVFSWPGIGLLGYQAIGTEDVPMIMGTVVFAAVIIVLMNLLIDILRGFLDPRIVYE